MGGGSCTPGPDYGPEDRRREFNRLVVVLPVVLAVQLTGATYAFMQRQLAIGALLLVLMVVLLVFLWRQYRAVKADEAETEHKNKP